MYKRQLLFRCEGAAIPMPARICMLYPEHKAVSDYITAMPTMYGRPTPRMENTEGGAFVGRRIPGILLLFVGRRIPGILLLYNNCSDTRKLTTVR